MTDFYDSVFAETDYVPTSQQAEDASSGERLAPVEHNAVVPLSVPTPETPAALAPPPSRPVAFAGQPRAYTIDPYPMYDYGNFQYPLSGETPQVPASSGATFLPLVAVAAGAVAGGFYGGAWGAGAGLFLTGAAVNAYRAMRDADGERKAHLTFGAIGAGVGGYMAYRAHKAKRGV